jgi:tRNA(Ile2) C34 agmatinyltransferase TiaS
MDKYGMEPSLKYACRICNLKMAEPNKGFDFRCAKCHEKEEGWC